MAVDFIFPKKNVKAKADEKALTGVFFTTSVSKDSSLSFKALTKDANSKLTELLKTSSYKGQLNDAVVFRGSKDYSQFTNILIVGLGETKNLDHEIMRRASAVALKAAKSSNFLDLSFSLETLPGSTKEKESLLAGFFEGFYLADYNSDLFKSKKEDKKLKIHISSQSDNNLEIAQKILKSSKALCESINFSRSLGDTPGNLMNPVILADSTKKAAQGTGLKVTIWDGARIKKEKMGCLYGVSLGGGTDPRFIVMEYHGGGKEKPICFVGKGLTFDSGGICIKPGAGMDEMKFDMCGGANVIGTMLAIAKLKLKVNVIGLVPASENMPGPKANKPGDILTARNGKTVEVINTDAEGRLILSDALVYASEKQPQFIVDAATLTGAMVIALGDTHTGFFSNNDKLTLKIKKAASEAGELVWEMPMHEEHAKDMKGAYADLQNVTPRKGAGSAHGAVFLAEFVDPKIPWAHFDIAGTAWNTGHRIPYNNAKGASGCMVRTFVELAKSYEK